MKKSAAAVGVAVAAISLAVGVTGCGSNSSSTKTSTSTSTSTSTKTSTSAQAAAPKTVDEYIQQNNIQQTPIRHDTPGAPTIDLPVPDGWTLIPEGDDAPYGGIIFNTPTNTNDAPRIIAVLRKLTGNVDTDKLLAAAPGEVKSLPNFDGGDGQRDTLGGFPAYEIGGSATKDGAPRVVAQKTVVIQGKDGIYLLQLNASAPEVDASALMDATKVIDDKTTITV